MIYIYGGRRYRFPWKCRIADWVGGIGLEAVDVEADRGVGVATEGVPVSEDFFEDREIF